MADFAAAEKFILTKLGNELAPDLTYHGRHHTLDVLDAAMKIANEENISEDEKKLLRIAALLHDSGFLRAYKGHEEMGCDLANTILTTYEFNDEQIKLICGMIMATKIPQTPHTQLERIIADADLDYLGRDDFYPIGNTLFEELKVYQNLTDEQKWNTIQLNFLRSHHYHTAFGKRNREPNKQKHLKEIEQLVASYK